MAEQERPQAQGEVRHSRHETDHRAGSHGLTEMEIAGLSHALDAEALAVRKCMQYAGQCRDQDARMLLLDLAAVHKRHWDQLLELLHADGDPTQAAHRILGPQ